VCLDEVLSISDTGEDAMSDQSEWDKKLVEMGLGMDRGSSPTWLTYGWQYRDADNPFGYATASKRPHKRTVENATLAQKLLKLMEGGFSQNAAAKHLGISSGTASNALRRFKDRVNSDTLSILNTFRDRHEV
jgi:hypothetical protein